ncbi:CaiB/BaiF CoA transferase family protein [Paraburkholderia antibiotica]|uniref:CoA transferase n=1 Tax=Paraburkholderia antibiotica TaxID=2728839 RepID=A0A7Y0A0Y3_9BURK|nr:CoA transferase [Paraburkholderia antibiotica]NML34493.1 CoA transferase [Paraburkholderia antibiotica]
MNASQPRPLEGLTILDLTTALAGPYATLLLAGLGARVIKIENPSNPDTMRNNAPYLGRDGVTLQKRGVDDLSLSLLERGRNKLGVTLNLKSEEGRAMFIDLARHADAVVENFSAGTADRLGIGYAALSRVNPRLVYTSISGFGADELGGQNRAMDTIVQALSGLMMTSGLVGDAPVRVGVPIGDLCAPLYATIGTLAALLQAQRTGQGQHVDVSLLGALTSVVACEQSDVMERLGQSTRTGNTLTRLAPFGVFAAADGHVAICSPTDKFVAALFGAMGTPDLAKDLRFSSRDQRVKHADELHALVEAWTLTLPTAQVVETLGALGVPCGEVRTPGEAVRDARALRRGETTRLEHPQYGEADDVVVTGLPIRMSGAFTGFDRPAPHLGEHNASVYAELLGLSDEQLRALAARQVI